MSYILDALRKSDQQRQRGAAPTLLLGPATVAVPKQRVSVSNGVIAAILVGAGLMIGWMRPWQPEPPASVTHAVAVRPPESVRRAPAPPDMPRRPEPEVRAQNARPAAQTAPVAVEPDVPARAQVEARGAAPEATATAPGKAARPPEQAPAAVAADSARTQTVTSMTELPVSLQQELPEMVISVHAYSGKPGDRLVGINNRMLREGDYVAPGLRLEQIAIDGMVFSYKGYSFRRGVK